MNDYYHPHEPYDDDAAYDGPGEELEEDDVYFISQNKEEEDPQSSQVDFNDPEIADLPRILLMGPRRGGKSSIQVRTDQSYFLGLPCCFASGQQLPPHNQKEASRR